MGCNCRQDDVTFAKRVAVRFKVIALIGAICARVTQLLLLLTFQFSAGASGQLVVVVLSVMAAGQVLADPGLALILSADRERGCDAGTLLKSVAVQAICSLVAIVLALALKWQEVTALEPTFFVILSGLLVLGLFDGVFRILRVPALHQGRGFSYISPDILAAVTRSAILVAVFIGRGDLATYFLIFSAVAFTAEAIRLLLFTLSDEPQVPSSSRTDSWSALLRSAAPVAFSTTVASGYSQIQVPLVAAFTDVGAASSFALAMRIVQASEIVALTLSQTDMPAMSLTRHDRSAEYRLRKTLILLALAIATVFLTASFVLDVNRYNEMLFLLAILSIAVPFKFANYTFSSALVAYGLSGRRLIASGVMAAVGAPLLTFCAIAGVIPAALGTVGVEVMLLLVLSVSVKSAGHRKVEGGARA